VLISASSLGLSYSSFFVFFYTLCEVFLSHTVGLQCPGGNS
jgi:hypothetical protein